MLKVSAMNVDDLSHVNDMDISKEEEFFKCDCYVILKVYLDNSHERVCEVPITPHTTCDDVVDCCRTPGEHTCHLSELWRGCERPVGPDERPYEILQQWGIHRDEVCFYLRHESAAPLGNTDGRRIRKGRNGIRDSESPEPMVGGGGVELTLTELQDMAARQQTQIDHNSQLLLAKEQRLKFLKQQELRHQQMASENERLRRLRERVDSQELKLKKLRAVRGQVSDHKTQNNSLSSELDAIKLLFNEKEKELCDAVTRVEDLTRQLEELRSRGGRINGIAPAPAAPANGHTATLIELDKLRKELMLRNKLNEQQNSKLALHREALTSRKSDMAKMDARIAELQARLRKKKQQQVITSTTTNQTTNLHANHHNKMGSRVAAVEPMQKLSSKESEDVLMQGSGGMNKQDPRYQSLPYSIKIGGPGGEGSVPGKKVDIYDVIRSNKESNVGNLDSGKSVDTSKPMSLSVQHVKQDSSSSDRSSSPRSSPAKPSLSGPGSRLMSSFAPKPYGSSYAATVLSSKSGLNTTADTSQPSLIYTASGMPQSDPMDSPMTSTPVVPVNHRPTAREMFMMGKQPPPPPSSSSQAPQSTAPTTSHPTSVAVSNATTSVASSIQQTTTVTTTPVIASTSPPAVSTITKPAAPTTKPAVMPIGGKFFPPLTVDTSLSSTSSTPSPSGLSPRTSAIVRGASYPVYQVAQSTVVTMPSQQSSSTPTNSSHQKSHSSSSLEAAPSSQKVLAPSPAKTKEEPPVQTPPGKVHLANSQKVKFSERLQSGVEQTSSPQKEQLSPNNNSSQQPQQQHSKNNSLTSTNSSSSEESSQGKQGQKDQDSNVDISPPSVSSAISVLMSGGTTTTSGAKPSYRYAPRSVIANTYMSKLGSGALDQYRKNMNQIYASFPPGKEGGEGSPNKGENNNNPPSAGSPIKPGDSSSPVQTSPSNSPEGGSNQPPPYPGTAPPYLKDNAERLKYRPNAPRPLRRRLSSGGDSPPDKTANRGFPHDVIRVNSAQDAFNNNATTASTAFTSQVDNLPFADEGSPKKYTQSPTKQGVSNLPDTTITITTRTTPPHVPIPLRKKKTSSLKSRDSLSRSHKRRVSFDPLALLLDASLEGELDLVKQTAGQVPDPSQANDEGITALHNAICAGHFEIVKYLVEFGCNVNAPDSDGWTPLHCAASCNNLPMVKLLVEHGACIFATTISDHETAAEKCEEDEDGYDGCSDYLYSIQEKLGIVNQGVVYAVFDYDAAQQDEMTFRNTDALTVLRKGDEREKDWWWARTQQGREGYIPRNLLGLYPRVPLKSQFNADSSK